MSDKQKLIAQVEKVINENEEESKKFIFILNCPDYKKKNGTFGKLPKLLYFL